MMDRPHESMNKTEEDPKTPSQSQHTKHQFTYMLHVPPTYIFYTRETSNQREKHEAVERGHFHFDLTFPLATERKRKFVD
jgi:hypothetical protein